MTRKGVEGHNKLLYLYREICVEVLKKSAERNRLWKETSISGFFICAIKKPAVLRRVRLLKIEVIFTCNPLRLDDLS